MNVEVPYLGVPCPTCGQDCVPDDKGRCMWCLTFVVRWLYGSYNTKESAHSGMRRARGKGLPASVDGLSVWVDGERTAA